MKPEPFAVLMKLLGQLEAAKIHHTLASYRCDGVSILAVVPGERWEIDVLVDGEVAFERFVSTDPVEDEKALAESIRRFAE